MQPSDTFLMVWAIGASVTASFFYAKFKKLDHDIQLLLQGLSDIYDGKAKIIKRGDSHITVKYIGDDNGDTSQ